MIALITLSEYYTIPFFKEFFLLAEMVKMQQCGLQSFGTAMKRMKAFTPAASFPHFQRGDSMAPSMGSNTAAEENGTLMIIQPGQVV